jgi:NitT/TauT family transport system substrate-binding protein
MTKIDRRAFLARAAAALAMAPLLQACGAATTAPSSSASSPQPAKPSAAASASPAASSPKPTAGSASAKPSGQLKLVAAQGTNVAVSAPVWMGTSLGLFEKQGIDFTLKNVGNTSLIPAMVNKEVDVAISSAAPIITAALNGNLDLVYVAAYLSHQTASVWVHPSITSATELKGKTLGSDRPGTPGDFNARQALSSLGLQPSDVNVLPIGSSDVVVKALIAGQVQAAVLGPPFGFAAEAAGFRDLRDAYDKQVLSNGAVILRSRIPELGAAMPGLLTGLRESVQAFNDQPDAARKVLQQYTKEDDASVVAKTYDFFRTKVPFEPSLRPNPDSLKDMLEFLGESVPAAKSAKPEQFIDMEFVDRLPK